MHEVIRYILPEPESASLMIQVLLAGACAIGLVLWSMGRQLARPGCGITGLVLGGLSAFAAADALGGRGLMVVWIMAGSIVGCALAWLLYRAWMGIGCSILLALIVAAVSLAWHGHADPAVVETVTPTASGSRDADSGTDGRDNSAAPTREAGDDASEVLVDALLEKSENVGSWWKQLEESSRRLQYAISHPAVIEARRAVQGLRRAKVPRDCRDLIESGGMVSMVALAGAIVGLLGGLLMPNIAAIFQSALVGALLMLAGAKGLLTIYGPQYAGFIPEQSRSFLLTLGLIMAVGFIVQWTVWYMNADK